MKYQPGFTDFFMSPVTGRFILPMMPDVPQDYIWIGNRGDRPIPSPIIIDLRLEIVDLRRRLSETRFILQAASQDFDSSQALNQLIPGILKHNQGIVSIAIPGTDYLPVELPYRNIWIGDEDNVPQPYPRIFLENLPSMASSDETKLFGAYNLYTGNPDPENIGIPIIVKTLNITNMADLPEGYLWLGTNSLDPSNFGPNRPVPIIVLPLANMADLPYKKIWRGDIDNRPFPVDDLSNIEDEIETIDESITNINLNIDSIFDHLANIDVQIGDINVQIGDINIHLGNVDTELGSIETHLGDIDTHLGNIDTHLGDIDVHLGDIDTHLGDIDVHLGSLDGSIVDLQGQIDSNVSSGLSHLADLQAQIDSNVSSGLSHLADLQGQIDANVSSGLSHLADLNAAIDGINSTLTTIEGDITTINTTLDSLQSQVDTINTTITTIQGDITNITTVLLPDIYTYIDNSIANVTNNFIAGGIVDMNNNRIKNLPCDPVEDNDAISLCFLWHVLHDEVTVSWP